MNTDENQISSDLAAKLGGDAGPKNGTAPTPADVAPHISGPHPVVTEKDQQDDITRTPTVSGAEALLKAQKEFIQAQQGYIHDQRLIPMVRAQKKYIAALIDALQYASPDDAYGKIASAQEIYITALTVALEQKGLI